MARHAYLKNIIIQEKRECQLLIKKLAPHILNACDSTSGPQKSISGDEAFTHPTGALKPTAATTRATNCIVTNSSAEDQMVEQTQTEQQQSTL